MTLTRSHNPPMPRQKRLACESSESSENSGPDPTLTSESEFSSDSESNSWDENVWLRNEIRKHDREKAAREKRAFYLGNGPKRQKITAAPPAALSCAAGSSTNPLEDVHRKAERSLRPQNATELRPGSKTTADPGHGQLQIKIEQPASPRPATVRERLLNSPTRVAKILPGAAAFEEAGRLRPPMFRKGANLWDNGDAQSSESDSSSRIAKRG